MAGFYLHTSNRIEWCAEKVTEIIARDPLPPMTPEIIVIPSSGMERFIAFTLANNQMVCANIEFPFPNAFIHDIFRRVLPDIPTRSFFSPEILAWRIKEVLPSLLHKKAFAQIKHYIGDESDPVKLFQLSSAIALIFDHYTIYRPAMLLKWESGGKTDSVHEQWQAELWRVCVQDIPEKHWAALRNDFLRILKNDKNAKVKLPERVLFFGISYLPGFHAEIVQALSHHIDIHCFMLNPCSRFWDDIVSEKYKAQKSVDSLREGLDSELLHYETGNSLLASLGSYGREFLSLLHELGCEESSTFIDPPDTSLLGMLQTDLLHLRSHDTLLPISRRDRSITIQICHSPLREIEVLHDNLLACFEQNPSLMPDDIIVMIPDIETYVPFIQTVFDAASETIPPIPYTIADLSTGKNHRIITDFFTILDCGKNRFPASSVLTILSSEAITAAAGLDEEDTDRIRQWVEETRIRWGIDKEDRERLGLPGVSENTWAAGLDRLFLGYALAAHEDALFNSTAPGDTLDSNDAALLGKVAAFLERLFSTVRDLEQERTLQEWSDFLVTLIRNFLTPDDATKDSFEILRRTVTDLSTLGEKSGCSDPVPFAVIRTYLESVLTEKEYGRGFMAGGVTFCTLLPMRSVPFPVLCLVGMNNGAFPRRDTAPSFDLVATHQRPGDRSVRKEDRYCFLECLLSARQKLYISYTGHDINDNSAIPPSVLVSELTDYLSQAYTLAGKGTESLIEHITTHHRLNACNPIYFSDSNNPHTRYFSYSRENAAAAAAHPKEPAPFITKPLPFPDDTEWRTLTIEQFVRFWLRPVAAFLENRLGIVPAPVSGIVDDTEPFALDSLDTYLLEQQLLDKKLSGQNIREQYHKARATGILPHGAPGLSIFFTVCERIEQFTAPLTRLLSHPSEEPRVAVDISLAGFTLTGHIGLITKDSLVQYRAARIKPEDRLRAWINHLILNLTHNDTLPDTTLLAGRDERNRFKAYRFSPVKEAETILTTMLNCYTKGLTSPLPFFPASSYAYAYAVYSGKPEEYALRKAEEAWHGNEYAPGESRDDRYAFFPGDLDPFTDKFRECAMTIFSPIFSHEQPKQL